MDTFSPPQQSYPTTPGPAPALTGPGPQRRIYPTTPCVATMIAPRTPLFTATSDAVDRYGDVVDPDGAVIERYLRNPVALLQHCPCALAGIVFPSLVRELDLARGINRWCTPIRIDESPMGNEALQAVEAGVLNAVSIGFNPLEQPERTDTGLRFTKWDWLETSLVSIPANPDALGVSEEDAAILGFSVKKFEQPDTARVAMALVRRMEAAGVQAPVLRAFALGRTPPKTFAVGAAMEHAAPASNPEAGNGPLPAPTPNLADAANDPSNEQDQVGSTMIYLPIPNATGKKLEMPGGIAPGDMHVTLAMLPDHIDLGKVGGLALDAMKAVCQRHAPIHGRVHGGGHFDPLAGVNESADGKTTPLIAHVDAPDLADVHHDLVSELKTRGIGVSRTHGFTPHVTRAFVKHHSEEAPHVDSTPLVFGHMAIHHDGKNFKVPFTGDGQVRAAEEASMVTRGVIAYEKCPLAPRDQPWDAAAAIKRVAAWAGGPDKSKIDWKKFSEAFAYVTPGEEDTFSGYKLPHHDIIGGQLKTVFKGVVGCLAALNGARGGVTGMSDADKKAAFTHLLKHWKEFNPDAKPEDVPKLGKSFEPPETDDLAEWMQRYNHNHDEAGRFSDSAGSGAVDSKLAKATKGLQEAGARGSRHHAAITLHNKGSREKVTVRAHADHFSVTHHHKDGSKTVHAFKTAAGARNKAASILGK